MGHARQDLRYIMENLAGSDSLASGACIKSQQMLTLVIQVLFWTLRQLQAAMLQCITVSVNFARSCPLVHKAEQLH